MTLHGCRCSLCNRTDILSMAETDEDYTSGPFYVSKRDARDTLCFDCNSEINEQLAEWYDEEEDNDEDEDWEEENGNV